MVGKIKKAQKEGNECLQLSVKSTKACNFHEGKQRKMLSNSCTTRATKKLLFR